MRLLNKVKCAGATNTASGRTRLRIAPDVIREARGMRLGVKVRDLWRAGCDIRVGYTVVGVDVGRAMRAPGARGRLCRCATWSRTATTTASSTTTST